MILNLIKDWHSGSRIVLGRFLRNPTQVGTIAPSSGFLSAKMIAHINWQSNMVIVEFGAGSGPFTQAIADRLAPEAMYIGFETESSFIKHLNKKFDSLIFEHNSAAELLNVLQKHQLTGVDEIISGLPFASLPKAVSKSILQASYAALKPGGSFVTFQYLHATVLPPAIAFRKQMHQQFGAMTSHSLELRNIPPALVFRWIKQ